jgi:16S rRNA (guanine527-N7)-methyltransferase
VQENATLSAHLLRVNAEIANVLERGANQAWNLDLSPRQIEQFCCYAELIILWNSTRMNLTRIVDAHDIATKHFLDSLLVLTALEIPKTARIMDIGTGAGLPGIALKIARPNWAVTLLDSTAKKLEFCRAVVEDLGLTGVTAIHGRAEEVSRQLEHAGKYDVVVSRAVAPLERLLPWCAPFARPGGRVVALKGSGVHEEMPAGERAAVRAGLGRPTSTPGIRLPESGEDIVRHLVVAVANPPARRDPSGRPRR